MLGAGQAVEGILGVLWFIPLIGFVAVSWGYLIHQGWWPQLALASSAVSLAMIILWWGSEATLQVTEKVLVSNRAITEMNNPLGSQGFWLLSPLLVALLVLVLLFVFGHAHLGLHARLGVEDKLKRLRSLRRGRSSALMIVFVLAGTFMFILASSSLAARALAFDSATKQSNQAESLQISLDRRYEVTKTGDEFDFKSQV